MNALTQQDITTLAGSDIESNTLAPLRLFSAWEVTTFILPMSIGHFRRVLREMPNLPQGIAQTDAVNAARWFTLNEVETLRAYFKTQGRKPPTLRPHTAPVVGLVQPYGQAGKTTGVLHLATAAALSGLRVLVIDTDPEGAVTRALAAPSDGTAHSALGVLPLIARSYGGHLLRANQLRLDQGETPQPMEDMISRALGLAARDVIRHSRYVNIDLIAAPRSLALADMQLGDWQGRARTWQPWRALHDVIKRDRLAQTYDIVFCDTGPGVGPLMLAIAASCDVLVMPVALHTPDAERITAAGLRTLADGLSDIQTRENRTARAMGQAGLKLSWRGVHLLASGDCAQTKRATAQIRARFGGAVLPDAMPEIDWVRAGTVAQFYDLAPRDVPRATYTALRAEMDACWRGLLAQLV